MSDLANLKESVREFWNAKSCGEVYAEGADLRARLETQAEARYQLEAYLKPFANYPSGAGRDVLEIGVGMGADHLEWAKSQPRTLTGVDLTERAIEFTQARLALYGLNSELRVADAENLPFADNSFDIVYSYGVLHHSPDTARAIREAHRVLRPGGVAKIMIYHSRSIVGYMLWTRYALLGLKPLTPLRDIYANYLESPGTKAFTVQQARGLFAPFLSAKFEICLEPGDLIEGAVGQRHGGLALRAAKAVWPRGLIRKTMGNHGLGMLITAVK